LLKQIKDEDFEKPDILEKMLNIFNEAYTNFTFPTTGDRVRAKEDEEAEDRVQQAQSKEKVEKKRRSSLLKKMTFAVACKQQNLRLSKLTTA